MSKRYIVMANLTVAAFFENVEADSPEEAAKIAEERFRDPEWFWSIVTCSEPRALEVYQGDWSANRADILRQRGIVPRKHGFLQVMPNMGWAKGPPWHWSIKDEKVRP